METKTRLIGHESLVVKAFREVFLHSSLRAGTLREDLERFKRVVEENPGMSSRDKKYADEVYHDGLLRTAHLEVPQETDDTVVFQDNGDVDEEYEEIFDFLDGAKESLCDDTDVFLTPSTVKPAINYYDVNGPFVQAIRDFVDDRQHPFVRVVTHEGAKYVIVGTFKGTIRKGPHAGKDLNVHCTVVPHRRLYDVPEIVKVNGDVLHLTDVDPETKAVSSICVLRHRPGMKIRFWANVGSSTARFDDPAGRRFVVITEDGWKEVSRQEF